MIRIGKIWTLMAFLGAFPLSPRAEVVFTFDDGSVGVYNHGLKALRDFGVKGTLYIPSGLIGSDPFHMHWGHVRELADLGWDIQAHSHTHVDLTTLSLSALRVELDESVKTFQWHGYEARHFAAPYGKTNFLVNREIKKRYASNRASWNTPAVLNVPDTVNRYELSAVSLTSTSDIEWTKRLIERAAKENVLLVFMIHQVKPDWEPAGIYNINYSALRYYVEYAVNQNAKIVTMSEYWSERGIK